MASGRGIGLALRAGAFDERPRLPQYLLEDLSNFPRRNRDVRVFACSHSYCFTEATDFRLKLGKVLERLFLNQ